MKLALLVALAAGLSALGCGGHGGPAVNCPQNLPASCPTTAAPSFATDVNPIYAAVCTSCHTPGGQMQEKPLTTYKQIYDLRETELQQIYDCLMPPVNGPPLSDAQRTTLMTWFVCGAQEN